ncbi:hypothetical protein BGZ49_002643 [Haplosporangium sp. Z 27]|nr:hypothetical protein BGZ49_002643 [Haplosporangium sp. Z 27]
MCISTLTSLESSQRPNSTALQFVLLTPDSYSHSPPQRQLRSENKDSVIDHIAQSSTSRKKVSKKKALERDLCINGHVTANDDNKFETTQYESIGRMDVTYPHCSAKLWNKKSLSCRGSSAQVVLPPIEGPPIKLPRLFGLIDVNHRLERGTAHNKLSIDDDNSDNEDSDEDVVVDEANIDRVLSNHFLRNIRSFNNVFAFTSTGCPVDQSFLSNGPNTFRTHRELYHLIGSTLANLGTRNQYAQFYSSEEEDDSPSSEEDSDQDDPSSTSPVTTLV